MRRLLILTLFLSRVHAADLPTVLADLHGHAPGAYARAEKLWRETKDAPLSARLATLLAFAPLGESESPAYTYAADALARDLSLTPELRLKMAKLAGEGYFEHGQFARAKQIFYQGLALSDLSEEAREYLQYQIAWSEINLHQPQLAIERLVGWLHQCSQCRVRREMASDIGKAFAETHNDSPPRLSPADHRAFAEGFASGLDRQRTLNLAKASARLRGSDLFVPWLDLVLSGVAFKSLTPCERLSVTSVVDAPVWPRAALLSPLRQCAESSLSAKPAFTRALVEIFRALDSHEGADLLLASAVAESAGQPKEACEFRLAASGVERPREIALADYLNATLVACADTATPLSISVAVADLLNQNGLMTDLKAAAPDVLVPFWQEVGRHPEWRNRFERLAPETWIIRLRTDDSSLSSLMQNRDWELAYRLRVWRAVNSARALAPEVLRALAADLSQTPTAEYESWLKEARKRAGTGDAMIALLELKRDPAQPGLYAQMRSEPSWDRLDERAKTEALTGLLRAGHGPELLVDWPLWSPRFEKSAALRRVFIGEAASPANKPLEIATALEGTRVLSVVKIITAWRRGEQTPLPATGVENDLDLDLKQVARTMQIHAQLKSLILSGREEQTAERVDQGLGLGARALKELRAHRWSTDGLARLNRERLRDAFIDFRARLEGLRVPAYLKLAKLIKSWEQRL